MAIQFGQPVDPETVNQMKLACLVIIVNKRLQICSKEIFLKSYVFFFETFVHTYVFLL